MSRQRRATRRYVCIHGHFYQPPRENAWLESIETQDSAHPYHDWNQRIDAECYSPNATARILDGQDRITRIVNNYERISFNFGPTLLSWLEDHAPETYASILDADRRSLERFGGHGSAIAQAYNHTILPLCNPRDKRTQVLWGLADFRKRFGREAEGMWLPETAADLNSLEVLAAEGVRYTILAPRQASAVREQGGAFRELAGAGIDPRRAYALGLPSGRTIALFFYDGPISQAVAFERLLARGDRFAARLVSAFDPESRDAQLVHLATDGETYGHHHRFGEMALAYALDAIERDPEVQLTNYGEFLAEHPPVHEARIFEPSSWSCAHGVGRWSDDCGCKSDHGSDWNQGWRRPLRQALDELRDALAPAFEHHARPIFRDPWAARDGYVDVILDRSDASVTRFIQAHATGVLDEAETSRALCLLEMQRNTQLMYTSCGWFFDEVSGIETQQILQYAARALDLAGRLFDATAVRRRFLSLLEDAQSNIPRHGNAARLYRTLIEPARAGLRKVGATWAAGLLFDEGSGRTPTPAYRVECTDHRTLADGEARLALGNLDVASSVTRERDTFTFVFLYPGEPGLRGGIRPAADFSDRARESMQAEITAAFEAGDLQRLDVLLARHFPDALCSLRSLFRDEQRRIVSRILESRLAGVEDVYQRLYDAQAPLMRLLAELSAGQPRALRVAGELVAEKRLLAELDQPVVDAGRLEQVLTDVTARGVALDESAIGFAARRGVGRLLDQVSRRQTDMDAVGNATRVVELLHALPFHIDLRSAQDTAYRLARSGSGSDARTAPLRELIRTLGVAVPGDERS